jgi:nucleoside-diphosphate-sugar epimerase
LIRELLAHGYEVSALVRTFDRARQLPAGVRPVPGDVTKPDSLRPAMRGADVVFHLAAWYALGARPQARAHMQRINVEGTRHTLELAAELGVPKIVHTSCVAVFGDTHGLVRDETYAPNGHDFASEYARTKHLAHYAVAVPLQQRGLPVVIACPGTVYGPGDASSAGRLLRAYARRWLWVMAGAENARAWTYVADVVAGLRLAAEKGKPGETYCLAGPALTYREFFAACQRATGIPAPRVWLPPGLAAGVGRVLERVYTRGAEVIQTHTGPSSLARSDKAQRELGWAPRPVEAGVQATVEWLREQG